MNLRHMGTSINKSYYNEFYSCAFGNYIPALVGHRERLWVVFNCLTFDVLWLGAGRYCGLGYPE